MNLFYTIVDYALKCKKKANELDVKIEKCENGREKQKMESERDEFLQRCLDLQAFWRFPLRLSKPEEDYLSNKRKDFPSKIEVSEWLGRKRKINWVVDIVILILLYWLIRTLQS